MQASSDAGSEGLSQHLAMDPFMRIYLSGAVKKREPAAVPEAGSSVPADGDLAQSSGLAPGPEPLVTRLEAAAAQEREGFADFATFGASRPSSALPAAAAGASSWGAATASSAASQLLGAAAAAGPLANLAESLQGLPGAQPLGGLAGAAGGVAGGGGSGGGGGGRGLAETLASLAGAGGLSGGGGAGSLSTTGGSLAETLARLTGAGGFSGAGAGGIAAGGGLAEALAGLAGAGGLAAPRGGLPGTAGLSGAAGAGGLAEALATLQRAGGGLACAGALAGAAGGLSGLGAAGGLSSAGGLAEALARLTGQGAAPSAQPSLAEALARLAGGAGGLSGVAGALAGAGGLVGAGASTDPFAGYAGAEALAPLLGDSTGADAFAGLANHEALASIAGVRAADALAGVGSTSPFVNFGGVAGNALAGVGGLDALGGVDYSAAIANASAGALANGAALAAKLIAAHQAQQQQLVGQSATTAAEPANDDGGSDGREKAISRLCERFPIDERAKNKLRGLPELLRKRIIKEFRPGPVATGDYSRALMGFLNGFPETRDYPEVPAPNSAPKEPEPTVLRNSILSLASTLGAASTLGTALTRAPGTANPLTAPPRWRTSVKANDRVLLKGGNALSQTQLETFRKKYPMDDRAMEYLRTASPEVQEQCVGSFRIREKLDDFSQAIIAHVRACRMMTGDRTPPPPEAPDAQAQAAQQLVLLAEFRSRYPFDDRTLTYMQQSGLEVIQRVIMEFQPPRGGGEQDFSKSITAFVRRCKEDGEKAVGTDVDRETLQQLNDFRLKYNFDERCLDYILQSNPEVRRRVLTEFQPPRGGVEGDFSKSITAFVRRCKEDDKKRCFEDEKCSPMSQALGGDGGASGEATSLAEFRQKFPFDDRAFEYIQQCRPEVRQRVLTEFKPSLSGNTKDYSKSITAFVRRCKEEDIRRCREAAAMPSDQREVEAAYQEELRRRARKDKEKAFAWMDSGDEASGSDAENPHKRQKAEKPEMTTEEALEDFRRRFPMDAMAFDFLCRSPKSVRHRVLTEFRPSDRGQNDNYSKQLTCFVRSCLKDAHGTGSILPSAKRTMGSFSMM